MNKVYHAYSSVEHDKRYGAAVYLNEDGWEVYCSNVGETRQACESIFKWPDTVYIGKVTKFIRSASPQELGYDADPLHEYSTKTTAWNNGYHAFLYEKDKSDNPYPLYYESHNEWLDGWLTSFYDYLGINERA